MIALMLIWPGAWWVGTAIAMQNVYDATRTGELQWF